MSCCDCKPQYSRILRNCSHVISVFISKQKKVLNMDSPVICYCGDCSCIAGRSLCTMRVGLCHVNKRFCVRLHCLSLVLICEHARWIYLNILFFRFFLCLKNNLLVA